jgi:hypothetical protein
VSAADRLEQVLERGHPTLAEIPDEQASRRAAPDRWSNKEVLGHLIDSAANNHQRFVRAQMQAHLQFPPYQQESWVALQRYAEEPWNELVKLWLSLNRHLVHVIRAIPESSFSRTLAIGDNPVMTLSQAVESYVDHLEHHLQQIFS